MDRLITHDVLDDGALHLRERTLGTALVEALLGVPVGELVQRGERLPAGPAPRGQQWVLFVR